MYRVCASHGGAMVITRDIDGGVEIVTLREAVEMLNGGLEAPVIVPVTIRQWYDSVSDGGMRYRLLCNLDPDCAEDVVDDLSTAVMAGFSWCKSPEGYAYWEGYYISLKP